MKDFNINILENTADLMLNCNLSHYIDQPTRPLSCLDLIISNIKEGIGSVFPLYISDHKKEPNSGE